MRWLGDAAPPPDACQACGRTPPPPCPQTDPRPSSAECDPTTDDAPAPRGPFFTSWGPLDGPILGDSPALGVLADRKAAMPIGIAYPVGLVEHRRGPAKTFRLVVGKVELAGRWICVGREFIALGEAAEEL